jgi:hypothetical protein
MSGLEEHPSIKLSPAERAVITSYLVMQMDGVGEAISGASGAVSGGSWDLERLALEIGAAQRVYRLLRAVTDMDELPIDEQTVAKVTEWRDEAQTTVEYDRERLEKWRAGDAEYGSGDDSEALYRSQIDRDLGDTAALDSVLAKAEVTA